jgi:hypothetical protein
MYVAIVQKNLHEPLDLVNDEIRPKNSYNTESEKVRLEPALQRKHLLLLLVLFSVVLKIILIGRLEFRKLRQSSNSFSAGVLALLDQVFSRGKDLSIFFPFFRQPFTLALFPNFFFGICAWLLLL